MREPRYAAESEAPLLSTALLLSLVVGQVVHVDASATGANDGTSWADGYVDLQSALAAAVSGDQVWVAAGTYKPSSTGDRSVSFGTEAWGHPLIPLYGGFAGTETPLEERAGLFDATILSGDLLGDDGPGFTNVSDNSYHVLLRAGGLDGFTIQGGNALPESLWARTAGV